MLRRIREPFGKAGLIVAVIALVAGLVGGAYAASGGLTGKQKKEVKKIAKEVAGKDGAQGPAGQAGSQGPKGDTGAAGANGTNGTNGEKGETGETGKAGKDGENGKSVSIFPLAPSNGEGFCEETGGVKLTNGGETEAACNGKNGESVSGEGYPKTLPSGRTMAGMWEVQGEQAGHAFGTAFTTISFPLPLATTPSKTILIHILKNNTEEEEEDCPGTGEHPEALPGFLCLYPQFEPESITLINGLASTYGAGLLFGAADTALGSWAVTAP